MRILFLISCTMLILTGCVKINEIQYQAYVVGLGIDYLDNEYHVHLQFADFSNVAKTQQGKNDRPAPVWLATGTGKSIEEAFTKVNQGIQLPVNFDQLRVFLFGKSLLENKLETTLQALDSNYKIRLTGWTYGTEEKLEDIFTTKIPFNYAFTSTRINKPEYLQQQDSTVPSITLQELIYQYNEKTKTILLPNISIKKDAIKSDTKKVPVSTFNGAFIIKDKKLKDLFSENDLKGYIRVNNKTFRSYMTISKSKGDNEEYIVIELLKPKLKRRFTNKQNDMSYRLDIKITGIISESSYGMVDPKIKKRIEEKIKDEVYETYKKSHGINGDIYQFEDYMYRFMYNDWKKYHDEKKFPTLKKEDIHVNITSLKSINNIHSGSTPPSNKLLPE
ncbi:Ger(x)C family spore germination protein [Bacillus sp. SD075]|uniref:Ger(x)C family spore germination protein n=1 Tax=Bacillus sp. SD075 TaxID=2781732 RepID=UPI001A95C8F4|nr:Ger(x)C family spore germination protein [Bacillus sp. SD075]MBO0999646.1 Ger(x)C family spore germination protein [Bacillus sp. SD075]